MAFQFIVQGICLDSLRKLSEAVLLFLQNTIARAASEQLRSLYNTKYTYGPGAETICKYWPKYTIGSTPEITKGSFLVIFVPLPLSPSPFFTCIYPEV